MLGLPLPREKREALGWAFSRPLVAALLAFAVAMGATVLALEDLLGDRVAAANPALRAGWHQVDLTEQECRFALGIARSWGEGALASLDDLERTFGPNALSDEEEAAFRAWVEQETEEMLAWVRRGCPAEGPRGVYFHESKPDVRYIQPHGEPDFRRWAVSRGLLPPERAPKLELLQIWERP